MQDNAQRKKEHTVLLRRAHREKTADSAGSIWLLTFNDMMTLLLTFFVLILSMSRVDFSKVEEASSAVGSAFGILGREEKAAVRVFDPFILTSGAFEADGGKSTGATKGDDGRDRFLEKRDAFIGRYSGRRGMTARATPQGIQVNIENAILFPEGLAALRTANPPELSDLCALLEGTRAYIRVSAGTEETPADRTRFPSGWELAAARAARVAGFMTTHGGSEPSRMSVSAYGPLKSGALKSGSLRNRGVEVTFIFHDS